MTRDTAAFWAVGVEAKVCSTEQVRTGWVKCSHLIGIEELGFEFGGGWEDWNWEDEGGWDWDWDWEKSSCWSFSGTLPREYFKRLKVVLLLLEFDWIIEIGKSGWVLVRKRKWMKRKSTLWNSCSPRTVHLTPTTLTLKWEALHQTKARSLEEIQSVLMQWLFLHSTSWQVSTRIEKDRRLNRLLSFRIQKERCMASLTLQLYQTRISNSLYSILSPPNRLLTSPFALKERG